MYNINIDWGDIYLFRTCHIKNDPIKRGIYHGSFRISKDHHIRRSVEVRCMIFKSELKKHVQ